MYAYNPKVERRIHKTTKSNLIWATVSDLFLWRDTMLKATLLKETFNPAWFWVKGFSQS